MTGGKAVAMTLIEQGCRTVYEVPGGQILSVMNSFRGTDVRVIPVRHENTGCAAADAFGRLTGEPGVCFATTGPGATNLLTAMGSALRDSSPMIALVFQNKSQDVGRGDAQDVDHGDVFKGICKKYIPIRTASVGPWAIREAYRIAKSGRPGPVVVDCFRDAMENQEVDYEPLDPKNTMVASACVPYASVIEDAAKKLVGYKSVAILAGVGAKNSHATDELMELAELLHTPVVSTHNGMSVYPTADEHALGVRTRFAGSLAREVFEYTECVLVCGSSLSASTTSRWALKLNDIIQIDIEPEQIGRHYPVVAGLVGNCKATLRLLIDAVKKVVAENDAEREKYYAGVLEKKAAYWKKLRESDRADVNASPVRPVAYMLTFNKLIDENSIVCAAAGNSGIWSQILQLPKGTRYFKPVNFGAMGFALPAAISCKLAEPDKDVFCLLGDGELGMSLADLETAAREKANIIVLHMNDGQYGLIKQEEDHMYGPGHNLGTNISHVCDYEGAARALGCEAVTIDKITELPALVEKAKKADKPFFINIITDGQTDSVFPEAY
ncbi:thiamine pyrophosphate-binding protein [Feifania hominis]|uniref:Thiamine pyrophosphate-binding protein n=1 Tax=Feifania hominis TaxID=2763660 RepID=A0A926HVS9_9FIRM|nr:thiamine pyrophosphate-binding protein [Feifania hominis]MBC8536946.1 thiamine pyrophosphate-binding protein [Feifania hominis]